MRFIIAPDWLMKLDDSHKLQGKQIKQIYGYHNKEGIKSLVEWDSIPMPEIVKSNPQRNRYYWSVGYIKNFLKLPTEINQEYVNHESRIQPLQKRRITP